MKVRGRVRVRVMVRATVRVRVRVRVRSQGARPPPYHWTGLHRVLDSTTWLVSTTGGPPSSFLGDPASLALSVLLCPPPPYPNPNPGSHDALRRQ